MFDGNKACIDGLQRSKRICYGKLVKFNKLCRIRTQPRPFWMEQSGQVACSVYKKVIVMLNV